MFRVLLPFYFAVATTALQSDPAAMQLGAFRNKTRGHVGKLTTLTGAPVEYSEAANGLDSPVEFFDSEHTGDIYTHATRKTIPERVLHAAGTGAFGHFVTTHDISHITKANLFCEIGKRTPIAVRFSPTFSSIGVRDTIRETRGMAVKFYTEEGNYDITAINFPVFSYKDPLIFPSLAHVVKRNPATNLPDNNMIWDLLTLRPETVNGFIRIFSYQGMPCSYAQMESFAIHTMQFYNESGSSNFGRWYMRPCEGTCYMNATAAANIAGGDPDFYARDLYNRIATGNYPCWELKLQVVPHADVEKHQLDIFDPTQELYFDQYPPIRVGKLILNKSPKNFFAQIEPLAFSPGNNVPGVVGGPDMLFRARRYAYKDTQLHRLGSNYKKIPVNCPMYAQTYNRDGVQPLNDNGGDAPNYFPNSFNGLIPYEDTNRPPLLKIRETGQVRSFKQVKRFIDSLKPKQKSEFIENLVMHLCPCLKDIKKRVVELFTRIHSGLGKGVAKGLAAKCSY